MFANANLFNIHWVDLMWKSNSIYSTLLSTWHDVLIQAQCIDSDWFDSTSYLTKCANVYRKLSQTNETKKIKLSSINNIWVLAAACLVKFVLLRLKKIPKWFARTWEINPPVGVAKRLLTWAHPPLGQILLHWDWMKVAMFWRGCLKTSKNWKRSY